MAESWFLHRHRIEVTQRSVSSSLFAKSRTAICRCTTHCIVQQMVTLQHHFSANCVFAVIAFVHFPQPSLQYNLYNQYNNTQLLNLSLCCNCTAVCAVSSCGELYSKTSWSLQILFFHSSPISK